MFRVIKLYKGTSDPTPGQTLVGYGVNQYKEDKCIWGIGWREPMDKESAYKLLGELSDTTHSMEFSFEPGSIVDNIIWSYHDKMKVFPNIALVSENVSFVIPFDIQKTIINIKVRTSNSLPPNKVILSRRVS